MAGIKSSYWIDKQYPIKGKTFHFLTATSQYNMLNALTNASGEYNVRKFKLKEHSRIHWEATVDGQPDTTYVVRQQDERPIVNDDEQFSVVDARVPEAQIPPVRKPMPKQLSFL